MTSSVRASPLSRSRSLADICIEYFTQLSVAVFDSNLVPADHRHARRNRQGIEP